MIDGYGKLPRIMKRKKRKKKQEYYNFVVHKSLKVEIRDAKGLWKGKERKERKKKKRKTSLSCSPPTWATELNGPTDRSNRPKYLLFYHTRTSMMDGWMGGGLVVYTNCGISGYRYRSWTGIGKLSGNFW